MRTKHFDLQMPDGVCDCFAAFPSDGKKHSGVLFFMDGYGPRDYLYDMARKLAALGYFVLLPNLFYRLRRAPVVDGKFPATPETIGPMREQIMQLFTKHDPESNVSDTASFLEFLANQPEVANGTVGVTGYCMGGALALKVAAKYPHRVSAAASFHGGRLATDAPTSPHRFAKSIRAKVYVAHADRDPSMPANEIEKLKSAFDEAGVKYESEIYEGASHGFTMADLPAYQPEALQRHWDKLEELFSSELVQ
jgi:carboxymethylenebutenolidase